MEASGDFERRGEQRFPVDFVLKFTAAGSKFTHRAQSVNLAAHGLRIASPLPIKPGTQIELKLGIRLPESQWQQLEANPLPLAERPQWSYPVLYGEVRSCVPHDGSWQMGVSFQEDDYERSMQVVRLYLHNLVLSDAK